MPDDTVVLDLGATKVDAVGTGGRRTALLPSTGHGADELAWLGGWLADSLSVTTQRILVSSAPELDGAGVVRSWPNRPHWVGQPLLPGLSRIEPSGSLRVEVVADGAAAALGEAEAHQLDRLVYLGLGTGVAAGWVVESRPVPVRQPLDLGHVVVGHDLAPCVCGRNGCLQAYASATGIQNRLARLGGHDYSYSWDQIARTWSSPALDPVRIGAVQALVAGIQLAAAVFSVDVVVLGGRVPERLPGLVDEVRSELANDGPELRPGRLGSEAALLGAVALAHSMLDTTSQEA